MKDKMQEYRKGKFTVVVFKSLPSCAYKKQRFKIELQWQGSPSIQLQTWEK